MKFVEAPQMKTVEIISPLQTCCCRWRKISVKGCKEVRKNGGRQRKKCLPFPGSYLRSARGQFLSVSHSATLSCYGPLFLRKEISQGSELADEPLP